MSSSHEEAPVGAGHALDVAEQALFSAGWSIDRTSDHMLRCAAPSRLGEHGGALISNVDPPALHFSVAPAFRPRKSRRSEIAILVAMINERLWLGHFDFWFDSGTLLYRHSMPLNGRHGVESGEIEQIAESCIEAIDRFLPAFVNVGRIGRSADAAFEAAVLETYGEA